MAGEALENIDQNGKLSPSVLLNIIRIVRAFWPLKLFERRREGDMKFLVLWHFELNRLGPEVLRAVTQMPDYAKKLGSKLECRYHVIGSHGGAWIYDVTSNEELDRLLAMSPVFNYATYQVLALAEMEDPRTVIGKAD
jgi:muconolactone D-isomerase